MSKTTCQTYRDLFQLPSEQLVPMLPEILVSLALNLECPVQIAEADFQRLWDQSGLKRLLDGEPSVLLESCQTADYGHEAFSRSE